MAEKIVALTVVDVAEMFDDAFVIRQCGFKLIPKACHFKEFFLGLFDQLWRIPTVMHDAMASVAEELEIAEIGDALAAPHYLIVENLVHTQVIAARLIRFLPITDFAESRIAHHAQLFPSPRIENLMQCLTGQSFRAGVEGEFE